MRRLLVLVPLTIAQPAFAQPHDHDAMPGMEMPATLAAPSPSVPAPAPTAADDMAAMPGMDHGSMAMTGATGPYPMTREASGTSWQPDASEHNGIHIVAGSWTVMLHGMLDLVYDKQGGPRGADKLFVAGMAMGMATNQLTDRDTIQLKAMLSPDPLMGKRGYPLLLAAGETADGRSQLTDRQHPHDLFMELAAIYSHRIGENASLFAYFGLPGEPAFGPPAFMHRQSISDSPEAPISHHWLDSTHITFGVATLGLTWNGIKFEASRFKGREPDQHRYDIETPKFDSTALRASWNPGSNWSLQASWAKLKSPEQLSADEDQERWSASAIYARKVGSTGSFAATAAWGRKTGIDHGHRGDSLDAYVMEAALKPDGRWTLYGRAERIDTDELLPGPGGIHGPAFTVGKVAGGVIRDFVIMKDVKFGIGAQAARSFTPAGLDASYGGDRWSGMGFLRLKIE